jgi:hypothetical protein
MPQESKEYSQSAASTDRQLTFTNGLLSTDLRKQQTVQSHRVWNFNNSNTTIFIHS